MRVSLLLLLYGLISTSLFTQTLDQDNPALEGDVQESNYQNQLEYEQDIRFRKFRINGMTQAEICEIPLITPIQARKLFEHIQDYGYINNIHELQVIEGFDLSLIRQLKDYLDFSLPLKTELKYALTQSENQHSIELQNSCRLEKSKAYQLEADDPKKYLGSGLKTYLRYTYQVKNRIKAGAHFEKDAGETAGHGCLSGFIQIHLKGQLKELIIGDYLCQFGQGMSIGSGLSMGKSPNIQNTSKVVNGFRPYRSGNEIGFWRGVGLSYQLGKHLLHTGISYDRTKVRVDGEHLETGLKVMESGYYRNRNELVDRNNGFSLKTFIRHQHLLGRWRVGQTLFYQTDQLRSQSTSLFQAPMVNCSFDYFGLMGNALVYGETQIQNSSINSLLGVLCAIGKSVDVNCMYRYYGNSTNQTQSNSISETGQPESGYLMGLSTQLGRGFKFSSYVDLYQTYTFSYSRDGPSKGKDALMEIRYEKRNLMLAYIRFHTSNTYENETGTQVLNRLELNEHKSWRFHIDYSSGKFWHIYHRIEKSWHRKQFGTSGDGFMSYHELKYSGLSKCKFYFRISVFDTDDYDTRIYAYEQDISHSFTVKPYQGKGHSYYLLFQYHVNKILNFKLRFATLKMYNAPSIGSGLDEVRRPVVHDLRIEMQLNL